MLFRMAEHHAAQNHCSQIRSNSSCIKEPVRSQNRNRLTKDKQQRKSIGLRLTINTSISAKMHKCDTHLSEVTRSVHWRRLTQFYTHTRSLARTHARHADGMSASVMMWTARWLKACTPDLLEELQPSYRSPCGKPTTCLDVEGEELVKSS